MKLKEMEEYIIKEMEKIGVIVYQIKSDEVPNLIFIMPLGVVYFVEIKENKSTKKKFIEEVKKSFTLTFDEQRGVFYKNDDEDFTLDKLIWAIEYSQY